MGNVALPAISGFARLVLFHLVKSLQVLRRLRTGTRTLRATYPHIGCNELTDAEDGYQELSPKNISNSINEPVLVPATISRYLCLSISKWRNVLVFKNLGIELPVFINPNRYYVPVVQRIMHSTVSIEILPSEAQTIWLPFFRGRRIFI